MLNKLFPVVCEPEKADESIFGNLTQKGSLELTQLGTEFVLFYFIHRKSAI